MDEHEIWEGVDFALGTSLPKKLQEIVGVVSMLKHVADADDQATLEFQGMLSALQALIYSFRDDLKRASADSAELGAALSSVENESTA